MRRYRYLHYDVFTDRPFEGNQLAVFPEPGGLSDPEMQTITREMNFSECTFVWPAATPETDVRMRIFTPGEELPMAGHPTIGTTFALAREGVIASGRDQFVYGLGVGPTPVSVAWKNGALDFAWMTQPLPTFGAIVDDRGAFTAATGIAASDLAAARPIQLVSCGVPFVYAQLSSRRAVDRVALDRPRYREILASAGIDERPLFVFTLDRISATGDETVYSRMLAPGFGISEDPATGSASGPLGCYLAHCRALDEAALREFVSLQGVAMKRPSRLHISIEQSAGAITRVRVGGRAVYVGQGELSF